MGPKEPKDELIVVTVDPPNQSGGSHTYTCKIGGVVVASAQFQPGEAVHLTRERRVIELSRQLFEELETSLDCVERFMEDRDANMDRPSMVLYTPTGRKLVFTYKLES